MANPSDPLPSRELLSFLLFDWLQLDERGADRETLMAVLDVTYKLAFEKFLPTSRISDIHEPFMEGGQVHVLPEFHSALKSYQDLGMFGLSFTEELGGLGLPSAAMFAVYAILGAANISLLAYPSLTSGNARVITEFGTPEQVNQFARPQIRGDWYGTMCLSEPHAGSSLGDIRTRATPDGEDELGPRFRIRGNKMWISSGDQNISENIVHLVLAKVELPDGALVEGTKGISLFIVPKLLPDNSRNDVAVAGLNHKLGYRGNANCLLNFGEKEGAVGWLIGEQGEGLAQMFMMMNEARIGVGTGAASLAYRGYRHASIYSRERVQGRPLGSKQTGPVSILGHADVRRMLLQQKAYAEGALGLCLYCAELMDQNDKEAQEILALLTPIVKAWSSEFGLIANDLAIQVHGGYGYTRDFDVEQLWRDNRLNSIHEGTTGIQALDLLGRKLLYSDGSALKLLRQRISLTAAAASAVSEWSACSGHLLRFWDDVEACLEVLKERSMSAAFDNATVFLRAFGHGVVAWIWLDKALCARNLENLRIREGLEYAARHFICAELPIAKAWLTVAGDQSVFREISDDALA